MYCLLNNKYRFTGLLMIVVLYGSCHQKVQKFQAPVEKVIRLDSTELGISTIISDLKVPWEITCGPNNQIWFTEQSGKVCKVNPHTGKQKILLTIPNVYLRTTPGLLGMAVYSHNDEHDVFVDYTYKKQDSTIVSRLVRYIYKKDTLINPKILLEAPGNRGHNGSRVAVSPDGHVYWATGDAQLSENAQNISTLNGKILRLNPDGSIPEDNPYPGSPVWSRGHRNPQGLAFTPDGILFSSEHGEATDDEINVIQKGGNYGWPDVRGYCDLPSEKAYCDSTPIVEPIKTWTPTIAPCGIAYYHSDKIPEWNNSILLTTLKGQSLRVLKLNNRKDAIVSEKIYFYKQFGRLRDVCVSSDGDVYISTSNRDWKKARNPQPHDDKIIRIAKISDLDNLSDAVYDTMMEIHSGEAAADNISISGAAVYASYCASCHRKDGKGIPGSFPALNKNRIVLGDKNALITILLKGDTAIKVKDKMETGEQMPAFHFLNDQQAAAVLAYIRSAWDNHADSVSTIEVATIRKQLKQNYNE